MDIVEFAKLGNKALIKKYGKGWMKKLSKKAAEKRSIEAKKRQEMTDSILPIDNTGKSVVD